MPPILSLAELPATPSVRYRPHVRFIGVSCTARCQKLQRTKGWCLLFAGLADGLGRYGRGVGVPCNCRTMPMVE